MFGRDVEGYHVGVICALSKEMMAARAMLDEEHGQLALQDSQDTNRYVLGSVREHNVVIACLPAGRIGTTPAATVASHMLRTFTAIRFALLVGIGGGVPILTSKVEIRLGDVVVSQPKSDRGGVVQYDLGKDLGRGRFKLIGSLNSPSTSLLSALSSLQSDTQASRRVAQNTSAIIQRIGPDHREYEFPGVDRDKLICTRCDRSQWQLWLWVLWMLVFWWNPYWTCGECDHGMFPRPLNRLTPKLHYGIIASGNQVIKNAAKRDQLRDQFEAKCVEMEAAGLMNDFQCLVVRGICNYADSHKNDDWQEYAAAAAAAFAKELLFNITPSTVRKMERVINVRDSATHELLAESIRLQKESETRAQKEDDTKCLRAFKTSTYEEYKNANPDRVPGTCIWVLHHENFQRWRDSTGNGLLWISADPGCGKSVLARCLIDERLVVAATATRPSTICYFFFKDNDEQNKLTSALCALLHQLFALQPHLLKHAKSSWDENGDWVQQGSNKLWEILLSAAADRDAQPIVCVLDALDECRDSDRRELITKLCDFYREPACIRNNDVLKFLVTSRPYDSVQRWFIQTTSHIPQIRLRGEDEHDQIGEEIDLVIDKRVTDIATEFSLSRRSQSELQERLRKMKHRTYLWLYLAIEGVREKCACNLFGDELQLDLLPSSVEDAYERILSKTPESHKPIARKILLIIIGARRPLHIGEMAHALSAAEASELDKTDLSLIDSKRLETTIGQLCGLFVFISQSRLFLIHQTAKEFLVSQDVSVINGNQWKFSFSHTDIELKMAHLCVTFLRYSLPLPKYHFFNYCVEHWTYCVTDELVKRDDKLADKVLRLYDAISVQLRSWYQEPVVSETVLKDLPVLCDAHSFRDRLVCVELSQHIFASEGYSKLSHNTKLETRNIIQEIELCLAALQGHSSNVAKFLRTSVDTNAFVQRIFIEYYEELLMRAGNIISSGGDGSAIHTAISGSVSKVVQVLLENRSLNLSLPMGSFGQVLELASGRGHSEVVRVLLDHGPADNYAGELCGNILTRPSVKGHTKVLQMLLKK